jgi:peptidoglycan/LPS O-acetylase OafA/YrhL
MNPAFYRGLTAYPLINANLGASSHSLTTLVGNLLLQPSFAVPAFGTNGPLWSLAFEFWFYALYPLLLLLTVRFGTRRTMGIVLAISVVGFLSHDACPWIPIWILQVCTYWIVWAVGAWIAEAYVARVDLPGFRWMAVAALAGLPALAIIAPRDGQSTTASDLCWSAAVAILLAYLILSPPSRFRSRIEGAAYRLAPLGDASYSLYVVHFPWLALLSAWWLSAHARLPLGIELVVPGAISALLLALCCWYLVERHFVSAPTTARPRPSRALSPTVDPRPETP